MKEEQRSNGEGYRDPTADAAVARAENEADMRAEKIRFPRECKTCGHEIDMDAVRKDI